MCRWLNGAPTLGDYNPLTFVSGIDRVSWYLTTVTLTRSKLIATNMQTLLGTDTLVRPASILEKTSLEGHISQHICKLKFIQKQQKKYRILVIYLNVTL